jgi:hypothetical protein
MSKSMAQVSQLETQSSGLEYRIKQGYICMLVIVVHIEKLRYLLRDVRNSGIENLFPTDVKRSNIHQNM